MQQTLIGKDLILFSEYFDGDTRPVQCGRRPPGRDRTALASNSSLRPFDTRREIRNRAQ